MKKRSHKCSGCQYFTKWKKDSIGGGLCEYQDSRTTEDKSCKFWKVIPYNRIYINTKLKYKNNES